MVFLTIWMGNVIFVPANPTHQRQASFDQVSCGLMINVQTWHLLLGRGKHVADECSFLLTFISRAYAGSGEDRLPAAKIH
jgi:hypothetical protein